MSLDVLFCLLFKFTFVHARRRSQPNDSWLANIESRCNKNQRSPRSSFLALFHIRSWHIHLLRYTSICLAFPMMVQAWIFSSKRFGKCLGARPRYLFLWWVDLATRSGAGCDDAGSAETPEHFVSQALAVESRLASDGGRVLSRHQARGWPLFSN